MSKNHGAQRICVQTSPDSKVDSSRICVQTSPDSKVESSRICVQTSPDSKVESSRICVQTSPDSKVENSLFTYILVTLNKIAHVLNKKWPYWLKSKFEKETHRPYSIFWNSPNLIWSTNHAPDISKLTSDTPALQLIIFSGHKHWWPTPQNLWVP